MRIIGILLLSAITACSGPATSDLEPMLARADAMLARAGTRDDACVRVHNLWRDQLRVAATSIESSRRERDRAFTEHVYKPHHAFWSGYVGNEKRFQRNVSRRWTDIAADSRANIPLEVDVETMIRETSTRAATLAGLRVPCADWYLVYGPGYTNMGGLSSGAMLVDFFGFRDGPGVTELEAYIPHEVAHLLFGSLQDDPARGTLLHTMLNEGLATYFSVVYSGGQLSPAQALGYAETEWQWALENEPELWRIAQPQLLDRGQDVTYPFRAVRERILPGAPGKIGYFIGYRIVESYVGLHGPDSWRDLFRLPAEDALRQSGYMSQIQRRGGDSGD